MQTGPQCYDSIYINIIAGPGAGKTTLAIELTHILKKAEASVEYVSEYAKELVWARNTDRLNNQYLVTKKQGDRMRVLDGQVEHIVTDSPVFLGLAYNHFNPNNVSNQTKVEEYIAKYDSECAYRLDVFLHRATNKEFESEGRIHDLKESQKIDKYLFNRLDRRGETFVEIFDAHHDENARLILEKLTECKKQWGIARRTNPQWKDYVPRPPSPQTTAK